MLAGAFIRWWYGAGWSAVIASVRRRMNRTIASFSVPTLTRTLFSPWKRIVAEPGSGFDARLRAMGDNAVSRAVGFTIRLTVLMSAGFALGGVAIFGFFQVILWPVMPLAVIGFIIGAALV